MKAAIYTRVSTLDQTTLNQELELKDFCGRNNYEIYRIYKEEGVSGAKMSRPQLDVMLQDMRQKKFDAIVVWKFDRLGRSTQHLLQVLEEMRNKGVELIATSQNIDTATPMGKFFFTILAGFAEMEREITRDRINLGMKKMQKEIEKKGFYVTKEGKKVTARGRPKGSRDNRRRRVSGYHQRWIKQSTP